MKKLLPLLILVQFGIASAKAQNNPVPLAQVLKALTARYAVNFIFEDQTLNGKTILPETALLTERDLDKNLKRLLTPLGLAWFPVDAQNDVIYPTNRRSGTTTIKPTTRTDTLSKGQIKGYVLDENRNPQAFATISLLSSADSTSISNNITDTAGYYHFNNIKPGNYRIRATAMGALPVYTAAFTLIDGLTVPPLTLKTSPQNLKQVNITASRPVVERKSDRFILNVANSPMASGSSLQLLKSAPFVNVSPDNEVTLQGKKTLILIDNRPVPGAALQDILLTLPAGNIATLELITDPSAKYDASYGAVINIVTKKNQLEGLTGTVRSEYSQGDYARENTNARLTYKHRNLTLFGSLGYNRFNFQTHDDTHRQFSSATAPDLIHEQIVRTFYQNMYNFQAGGNLDLSKNQSLGILIDGRTNSTHGTFNSKDQLSKLNGPLDSTLNTHSPFSNKPNGFDYNLNYHLLADSGKTDLSAFSTLSPISRRLQQDFTSELYNGSGQQLRTPYPYQSTNTYDFLILVAQADLSRTLPQHWKLETGLKYQSTDSKQSIDFKTDSTGQLLTNPQNSSSNHITERIIGTYTSLTKKWTADQLRFGLRLEYAGNNYVGHYNLQQYDLFPSLLYVHDLSKNDNISLSYRRTINRVPYDELVPYRLVINQYNVNLGNPGLKPQYNHTFSINTKLSTLNISVNYSLNNGILAQTPITKDPITKVTYFSYQNLGPASNFFIDVYYPYQFTHWWATQNSGTLFGYSKATGTVLNEPFTVAAARFAIRSNQTFTLNKTIKLEVDGYYNSSRTDGLTSNGGYGNIDAGLLIGIWKDKGQLRIGGEDLLKRTNYYTAQDFGSYSTYRNRYFDSRRASISLSYNFGQTKIKTPVKKLGNEDAVDRSN